MTLAEYESCPQINESFELDEGALVAISPAARPHAKRIDTVYRYLIRLLPQDIYDILPGELGFILSVDPSRRFGRRTWQSFTTMTIRVLVSSTKRRYS